MITTTSFKTLAKRHGVTVATVRDTAHDLGLRTGYDRNTRTWVIQEPAAVVAMFNTHLDEALPTN